MYAKIITPTMVDTNPPTRAKIDGAVVVGRLPAWYLATLGYYPLVEEPCPANPREGFHFEARYSLADGNVVRGWTEVEDPEPPEEPPHVYSKLKILLAAKQAGFIDQLMDMIEADRETSYFWNASNTIEDNELLAMYLPVVAEAIEKTPEEVRAFLDGYCLAD